jgi:hypothetical protein
MGVPFATPENPAMIITNTASLTNLAVLPSFIKYTQFGTGATSTLNFEVNTSDDLSVGTYHIIVTATYSLSPLPSQT